MIELAIACEDFCYGGLNEWRRFLKEDEYQRLLDVCEEINDLDDTNRLRFPHLGWDFDSFVADAKYQIRQDQIKDSVQNFLTTTDVKAVFHYRWKRNLDTVYPEPFYLYGLFETEEDALIFKCKFT